MGYCTDLWCKTRLAGDAFCCFCAYSASMDPFTGKHRKTICEKSGFGTMNVLNHNEKRVLDEYRDATIGIVMSTLGVAWFDPLAGALVAIMVTKTGFSILQESSNDLMDAVPSKDLSAQIRSLLYKINGIDSIEEIHSHRFGPYLVANITIGINGELSVKRGDAIASSIETLLVNEIDMLRKVYVHYHPSETFKKHTT